MRPRAFQLTPITTNSGKNFPNFLDLSQIVNQCSMSLDPNLEAYVNERVFLIKERPGDDHWLRDYPPHVRLLVERAQHR